MKGGLSFVCFVCRWGDGLVYIYICALFVFTDHLCVCATSGAIGTSCIVSFFQRLIVSLLSHLPLKGHIYQFWSLCCLEPVFFTGIISNYHVKCTEITTLTEGALCCCSTSKLSLYTFTQEELQTVVCNALL